jgi:hypothetical protein
MPPHWRHNYRNRSCLYRLMPMAADCINEKRPNSSNKVAGEKVEIVALVG